MTTDAATTARKLPGRPFKAGAEWNGNARGRPKGSKHKLSEEFLAALAEDFAKHGAAAIRTMRKRSPAQYVRMVADLMPKDFTVNLLTHEDALAQLA